MFSNTLVQLLIGLSAIVLQASSTDRIVGGQKTTIAQYPYMVSIYADGFLCGGAIIQPDIILSAAHCFKNVDISNVRVTAGSTIRHGPGAKSGVSQIAMHSGYNTVSLVNDIALLKLDKPLVGKSIETVSLASSNPPENVFMTATGWGLTSENGEKSNELRVVQLRTLSGERCRQVYREKTSSNQFCAIDSGKDTCQGDSGGPLVYRGTVYGVVSYGSGCARENSPGVYTNVFAYRNWISQALSQFKH